MWANPWQGGGGWPIQQANFQGMPADQVDWASLAKQWIAQKEAVNSAPQNDIPPQAQPQVMHQAPIIHPGPPPPPPPEAQGNFQGDSMDIVHEESENGTGMYGTPGAGWGWEGGGGMQQHWETVPQGWGPTEPHMAEGMEPQEFDYNHGSFQQFNYNHGGEEGGFHDFHNKMKPDGNFGRGRRPWGRGPHHGGNFHPRHGNRHHRSMSPPPMEEDNMILDAAKRKTLPTWIRDGLEKMEKEKQKKLEKEKKEREAEEARLAKEKAEKEAEEKLNSEKEEYQKGPRVPRKSRFDSDDDDDEEVDETLEENKEEASVQGNADSTNTSPQGKETTHKRSPSPEIFKTEEEKQMEFMIKVRRMLTEILLDVTDGEVANIAKEVHRKAKLYASKAPATQIAKSTALASITSLGLGYGSDSSGDEEDGRGASGSERESDTGSESDADFGGDRLRSKRDAFEKLQRQRLEDQEREEKEMKEKKRMEIQNTPSFLKEPLSDSHNKYPFQQGEQGSIPGLETKPNTDQTKSFDKKSKEKKRSEKEGERDGSKKKKSKKESSSSSSDGSSGSSSSFSSSSSSDSSSNSSSDSETSSSEVVKKSLKKSASERKSKQLYSVDSDNDNYSSKKDREVISRINSKVSRSNSNRSVDYQKERRRERSGTHEREKDDRERKKGNERQKSRKEERSKADKRSKSREKAKAKKRDRSKSVERGHRSKREERSRSRERGEKSRKHEKERRDSRKDSYDQERSRKYEDNYDESVKSKKSSKRSRRDDDSPSHSKSSKSKRTRSDSSDSDYHTHSKRKSSRDASPKGRRRSHHDRERDEYEYERSGKKSSHKHRSRSRKTL